MRLIDSPIRLLADCYDAAIAATEPARVMDRALDLLTPGPQPVWIVAVGKAAPGMYRAVERWLGAHRRRPAGGICIASTPDRTPSSHCYFGDHPVPGPRSLEAAGALGVLLRAIPAGSEVHVCISGGASSLIAAPLSGIAPSELTAAFIALLGSGLDIDQQNAVRKRLTRWSAGRLGSALRSCRVRQWIISDVPGDDVTVIGSGPCVGDPWTAAKVTELVAEAGVFGAFSPAVQQALTVETLKPGDGRLAQVTSVVVACNRDALIAAASMAEQSGFTAAIMAEPLAGAAYEMGRRVAAAMAQRLDPGCVLLWGGETTVSLSAGHGVGGRSQELALSAAADLAAGNIGGLLLAAGTDGRDGPTDAAGAVVDRDTWNRISARRIDPAAALRNHATYDALSAVGALFCPGPTGTNVMDVVFAANASPPESRP